MEEVTTIVQQPTFMDYLIKMLGILIIVGVVYMCMAIYYRLVKKKNGNVALSKLIPIIAVIFGAFLAILLFVKYPEIMPVYDIFTAMILGAFAGAAAVGINQFAVKTFGKPDLDTEKKEQKQKKIRIVEAEKKEEPKPEEPKSYIVIDDDLEDL